MAGREIFKQELAELKGKLLELAACSLTALEDSFTVLEQRDQEKALHIIDRDEHADLLEEEINQQAMLLIARQQPVAVDLRMIIAAIKTASDLERMADFGVNIAKASIRIGNQPFRMPGNFRDLHHSVVKLMLMTFQALREDDSALAERAVQLDDRVDHLYGECMRSVLDLPGESIHQAAQLSLIARFLERTADHAVNIAENIYYQVHGRLHGLPPLEGKREGAAG